MKECCKQELESIRAAVRDAGLGHSLLSWSPWLLAFLGSEETRIHKRAFDTIASYIDDEVREWEFNSLATTARNKVVKLPDEDDAAAAVLVIKRSECLRIAELHLLHHMMDNDRQAQRLWQRMVALFEDKRIDVRQVTLPAE